MPWTTKAKDIATTSTTPHASSANGVIGRAPTVSSITFTPAELFGAAARCSYLNLVNPVLVTPESLTMQALIEQHVDDVNNDFAILSSADNFKDYAKSYFSGTVAAGIAYLAVVADGYTWADHFEHLSGGNPGATRSPDFVFAKAGQGDVALVESKGTRSASQTQFDKTVADGYVGQIEPHLGYTVGTTTATHGYCVGAWLTSPTKAQLNIHHTDAVSAAPTTGPSAGLVTAVQQHNFATAFGLAHSDALAQQVRSGRIEQTIIPFFEFEWLKMDWLTLHPVAGYPVQTQFGRALLEYDEYDWTPYRWWASRRHDHWMFAIERNSALEILRYVSRPEGITKDIRFDLQPMSVELRRRARGEGEVGGALFPDGLAVVDERLIKNPHPMFWDAKAAKLMSVY